MTHTILKIEPKEVWHIVLVLIGTLFTDTIAYAQAMPLEAMLERINSPYDEQNLLVSPDGNTLYFTRSNHPENMGGSKDMGDVWYAQLDDSGRWSEPSILKGEINDQRWNGIIGFASDGNTMYLHQQYPNRGGNKGISVSRKTNGGWSKPKNLDIPYFSNKSKLQSANMSKDRTRIVFSLESFGSHGGEDLYMSELKSNGKWSEPRNLGSSINTPYQELTPFLGDDDRTLYFSTNGRGGFGSYDVFVTHRLDDTWRNWSKPENLGASINSQGRELYFRLDDDLQVATYATTQNSDGYGDFKLINYKAPEVDELPTVSEPQIEDVTEAPVLEEEHGPVERVAEEKEEKVSYLIQGIVKNAGTKNNLAAIVKVSDHQGRDWEIETNNGHYSIKMPQDGHYTLKVLAPGYVSLMEKVELSPVAGTLTKDFELHLIDIGKSINLNHVRFAQGTVDILADSYPQLDGFIRTMSDNPSLEVELGGHTDNRGSSKLNFELSRKRADKIKEYLVEKGINGKRISTKGYGGSKPIANNNNPETRKLNRRVEFTVTKK